MNVLSDILWRMSIPLIRNKLLKNIEIKIDGIQNLPKKPFVVIANHDHPWDPPIIACILYNTLKKKTHFFTGKFLFKGLVRFYLIGMEQIAVQSGLKEINELAFKKSKEYIRRGDIVGIFPYVFDVVKKKKIIYGGIVRLLQENDVDFVPIYIRTHEKWKWKSYYDINFDKTNIYIGKLKRNNLYKKSINEKQKIKITRKMMNEIYKLSKC